MASLLRNLFARREKSVQLKLYIMPTTLSEIQPFARIVNIKITKYLDVNVCRCNYTISVVQCPQIECPNSCPESGYFIDKNGCTTCLCKDPCREVCIASINSRIVQRSFDRIKFIFKLD